MSPTPDEKEVDEEIAQFAVWFQGWGNNGLTSFERSIIKTFLYWKYRVAKKSEPPQPRLRGQLSPSRSITSER